MSTLFDGRSREAASRQGASVRSPNKTKIAIFVLIAIGAIYLIAGTLIPAPQDHGQPVHSVDGTTPQGAPESAYESETELQVLEWGSESCLTVAQLEEHPLLIQDGYRFDAVSDTGPTIQSYRGLTEAELLNLAAQQDSAAMVVLGAMSTMRARDWPVEKAVSFLTMEDEALRFYSFKRPLSPEFLEHTADAREWFYKAALHGRVLALNRVGDALSFEVGNAVDLGWISKEEYEDLSSAEKTALNPANVYNVMAYELVPELKSGPIGDFIIRFLPRSERQLAIVDVLAEEFNNDLRNAGLEPVAVPESDAPSIGELMELVCESERQLIISDAENER